MKLDEWILSDDTGESSKALWAVAKDIEPYGSYAIPYDSWDFGRCYRFLQDCFKTEAERRQVLFSIAMRSKEWYKIVERWKEMSALYKDRDTYIPKITKILREIQHNKD